MIGQKQRVVAAAGLLTDIIILLRAIGPAAAQVDQAEDGQGRAQA